MPAAAVRPSMTDPDRDPLAAFDDGVLARVARERDLPPDRLRELAARQQETVRGLPGVDDLVYEYRKAFARDPVAERRAAAYYLLVPGHVWPEFGDALSLSEAELAALRALHDRQLRAAVGADPTRSRTPSGTAVGDRDGDREPLVLVRP